MNNNCALVAYPLSQTFQKKLEHEVGEPIQYFLLGELREKPLYELWTFLRKSQPGTFFIPVEDYNTKVLLPILQLIVKVASPKQMIVVHPDFSFETIKLNEVVRACLTLAKATLSVNLHYRFSRHRMTKLLNQSISECKTKLPGPKHVLYLNTNLWFGVKAGGSVGHIAGVVNGMAKTGWTIDYAGIDKSSLLISSVNHVLLPNLNEFGIPAVLNYYSFNKIVHDHLCFKKKPDWKFIYQRMSTSNFSGVTLSRQLNIPLVLEYNGSEVWVAKNWGGRREHEAAVRAEEICLRHAHLVVTVSEVLKQELITRDVPAERIVCYPNCIDPTLFNPDLFSTADNLALREKHGIPYESMVLTFVGTFGQWHGVNILAQAIRVLLVDHELWLQANKVHFLLVGDGVRMSEVKQILGDFIHSQYVTLTGLVPQHEAPAYLSASDVLLSPHVANADGSRFFGSPTKLFEYMAMGKAIIASDLDQIGDVLQDSLRIGQLPVQQPDSACTELAVLCEPGHVQQLVDAMRFLVENKQWRDILGSNVRQEALAKYTWEQHVDAFLSKFVDVAPMYN